MKSNYIVMVEAQYVDGCAIVDNPAGEFGGDGYVELKESKDLVLETLLAKSGEDAIEFVANQYDVSAEILVAHKLAG